MQDSADGVQHSRLGLALFAIYTLFYAGFVLVNAFAAEWSEWIPFGGVNLAIQWGFGLILLAFILAAIYGLVSGPGKDESRSQGEDAAP